MQIFNDNYDKEWSKVWSNDHEVCFVMLPINNPQIFSPNIHFYHIMKQFEIIQGYNIVDDLNILNEEFKERQSFLKSKLL